MGSLCLRCKASPKENNKNKIRIAKYFSNIAQTIQRSVPFGYRIVLPVHPINPTPVHRPVFNPDFAELSIHQASVSSILPLPLVNEGISAGFPSPALDFEEIPIDLNKHLIKHPSSTFFGIVKGYSMKNAGIGDGDLLVIDKSLDAADNRIAVCFIDGEFLLKRIRIEYAQCWLIAENEKYKPILVTEENDFLVWGIVTYVIKSC